jgi:ParB-like chromosome segregation protein Spo0J
MSEQESIGGYVVHPAAALFPLIEGQEFDKLVDSIAKNGVQHPVVVRGRELLDGRNRLRAVEAARAAGHKVEVPVVEWKDDGRSIAEWIWDTNANRRHLTDDGLALAAAAISPLITKECRARKKATTFTSATAKAARATVRAKTTEPKKRDHKAEDSRSTVGQVAAKAKTSRHKARQAIAVQKAVAAGTMPAQVVQEVVAGKKKLRDIVPSTAGNTAKRTTSTSKNDNRRAFNRLQVLLVSARSAVDRLAASDSKYRESAITELQCFVSHLSRHDAKQRKPEKILDDLRLLLGELLACGSVDRQAVVDELNVWIRRAT